MASSDALEYFRHRGRRWQRAAIAAQWAALAVAVTLVFFAALHLKHAIAPMSGLGAQLIEISHRAVDDVHVQIVSPVLPALNRAGTIYLLMIAGLIASMTAAARDVRVHLLSLALAATVIAALSLHTYERTAQAERAAEISQSWGLAYTIIAALFGAALVVATVSFRMRHVPRRTSQLETKRKEQFLMMYWALVVVFCIFEFFYLMAGPQASGEDAGSAIMIIAVTAALLLLALYFLASVLIFALIMLWKGAFAVETETPLTLISVSQNVMPSPIDPAIYPAAATTFLCLTLMAWIGYSICAVSGAIRTMTLVYISIAAVSSAALVAIVSAFA